MVIDHSTDSPVKVCTWNDLSGRQCEALVSDSENFKVIGIIALRPITRKAKTLPHEIYWLRVIASDIQYDRLRAYIGCSYYGKRTQLPLGTVYACIAYGTGSLQLTAFTENSVPLLGMSAEDIYHMKAMDDTAKFAQVASKLRNTYFLLKIGPTTALEQNNVLQWGIKGVEMEDTVTADGLQIGGENTLPEVAVLSVLAIAMP
uniref:Uncharacterized protein n=1 Tax=Chenopodium quinoa TaxID=63459 RepID=A0A803MJ20_CHEQI